VTEQVLAGMLAALYPEPGETGRRGGGPDAGFAASSSTGTASIFASDMLLVACDADILNREQLRGALECPVAVESDAALLAALYLEQGMAFLPRLRGVFSVAIRDRRSRTLFLAIDRFAVKPLSYADCGN